MKLRIGDIFTIPVSEEKTGFGQIVKIPNKNNFIIIVYENIYSGRDWPSLEEVVKDKILFLGYTMDALLYHKFWKIIGNVFPDLSKIKFPYYKLGTFPNAMIVNYKGEKVKTISKLEFDKLQYETVVAPVRYENALKAYYKLSEWREDYDNLLYSKTLESIQVVEGK
ncbi:hypothetical protein A8C56_14150 [Niabella ginsenosidivorans]|uniref:Immunity protein 26 n=1 Tax=Niabella ginsenosidivorans TaxID=1176587 RepID=A0A1A9I2R7_9BACT|nr:Imm26 family immunity protein [Niabella ginsenosidivorans]ANH81957.1 hypothetical protein A8C56_14150 [Niabella ginsenosidivorans]